jgi:hypothetical protein
MSITENVWSPSRDGGRLNLNIVQYRFFSTRGAVQVPCTLYLYQVIPHALLDIRLNDRRLIVDDTLIALRQGITSVPVKLLGAHDTRSVWYKYMGYGTPTTWYCMIYDICWYIV